MRTTVYSKQCYCSLSFITKIWFPFTINHSQYFTSLIYFSSTQKYFISFYCHWTQGTTKLQSLCIRCTVHNRHKTKNKYALKKVIYKKNFFFFLKLRQKNEEISINRVACIYHFNNNQSQLVKLIITLIWGRLLALNKTIWNENIKTWHKKWRYFTGIQCCTH